MSKVTCSEITRTPPVAREELDSVSEMPLDKVAEYVSRRLSDKTTFVFGELLQHKRIKELQGSQQYKGMYELLEIFGWGTFADYLERRETLPPLGDGASRKLKMLSVVSAAYKSRTIGYDDLMHSLSIQSTRGLEDLIIECIYSGLVSGKMDQRDKVFRVKDMIGRDVPPEGIDRVRERIGRWRSSIEAERRNALEIAKGADRSFEKGKKKKERQKKRINEMLDLARSMN